MLLDFADKAVGFVLRHLAATHHVLHEIARALGDESRESRRGADHVLHGRGHLAAGLETDLLRLRRHLGDGVSHVLTTMPGAAARRNRRRAGNRGSGRDTGGVRRNGYWRRWRGGFVSHSFIVLEVGLAVAEN